MHKHKDAVESKIHTANKVEEIFSHLCESIDSPRALTAYLLFKYKEFDQLVALEINQFHYNSSNKFADDYLVTSFLSKYPNFRLSKCPEEAAWTKFRECENACSETNKRFRELELDPSKWDPQMQLYFREAKRKIAFVLGRVDFNELDGLFSWGPGATSASKSTKTSIYDKFKARLDVTSAALVMGSCCVNSRPSWVNCQLQTDAYPSIDVSIVRSTFNVVRGNEIVFVPKNAKTHRSIAIEPHVNSYLQKGFGSYIRHRLKRYADIDLNDQTVNQRLARQGSHYNDLATIDLSGASDTISIELVRYLLPEKWFVLLDSIRSKQGRLRKADEPWFLYEKFSSMGNGFTFELESLIFWALCRVVVDGFDTSAIVSVYGDDLIVPVDCYPELARVIAFAGFSVNEKKSFSSGPFRESCGKDYFHGDEVRPIFLKEDISNVEAVYKLANSIRRYSHLRCFNNGCDIRFLSTWSVVFQWSPVHLRFKTPSGSGDCGFAVNFDEATPDVAPYEGRVGAHTRRTRMGPTTPSNGWGGWHFNCLQRRPLKTFMRDLHAGYTACLSAAGSEEPLLGFVNQRGKTFLKRARGYTLDWYDFGGWVSI